MAQNQQQQQQPPPQYVQYWQAGQQPPPQTQQQLQQQPTQQQQQYQHQQSNGQQALYYMQNTQQNQRYVPSPYPAPFVPTPYVPYQGNVQQHQYPMQHQAPPTMPPQHHHQPIEPQRTQTIRNQVNLKKPSLAIAPVEGKTDTLRLTFTLDATSPCTATVFWGVSELREEKNKLMCPMPPLKRVHFEKGLGQVYSAPENELLRLSDYEGGGALCTHNEQMASYPRHPTRDAHASWARRGALARRAQPRMPAAAVGAEPDDVLRARSNAGTADGHVGNSRHQAENLGERGVVRAAGHLRHRKPVVRREGRHQLG